MRKRDRRVVWRRRRMARGESVMVGLGGWEGERWEGVGVCGVVREVGVMRGGRRARRASLVGLWGRDV